MASRVADKYRLEAVVRSGPFGPVYQAEQVDSGAVCAVHVLQIPPPLKGQETAIRAAFVERAATLGRLEHPSVPRILETGIDDRGPYVVSELVEGRSLVEVAGGGLGASRASLAAEQIVGALARAHQVGIIHGDLAPTTVLAGVDPSAGESFRVVDLGVGTAFESFLESSARGQFVGRPQYAAPERFRGYLTASSDVYACGLLLWLLVTGDEPVEATSVEDCMDVHLGSDLWVLPDEVDATPEVRRVIETALQRHPKKRYADAQEMLRALHERVVRSPSGFRSVAPRKPRSVTTGSKTITKSPPQILTGSAGSAPTEKSKPIPKPRPTRPVETRLEAGDVIAGKYEVIESIGTGGFSRVYRGLHRDMERDVAIKLLDLRGAAELASVTSIEDLQNRFSREAKFASKLTHANTLTVYDFGVDEGRWYLVSEFVDGPDLFHLVRDSGALEPRRACQIALDILGSLEEAHHLGILHRDLKTSNVMLTTDYGGNEVAKVVDFGMATVHEVHANKPQTAALNATRMGLFIGTPQYAAPEQFLAEALTPATDIYAVGLILWEMLIGEPAANEETFGDCLQMHLSKAQWQLPETASVPDGLDAILYGALNKNPAERYQSADAMAADLRAWMEGGRPGLQLGPPSEEGWSPAFEYRSVEERIDLRTFSATDLDQAMIDPNVMDEQQEVPELLRDDAPGLDEASLGGGDPGKRAKEPPAAASTNGVTADPSNGKGRPPTPDLELDYSNVTKKRGPATGPHERLSPSSPTARASETPPALKWLVGAAVMAAAALVVFTILPQKPEPPVEAAAPKEAPAPTSAEPASERQPEPSRPAPTSRFSSTEILAAVGDLGWKASRTGNAVTESGTQLTYALRRGGDKLQLQVVETTGTDRANTMAADTRPPAAAVVLDNYLVRVFPDATRGKTEVREVAAHLANYRDSVVGPGTAPPR